MLFFFPLRFWQPASEHALSAFTFTVSYQKWLSLFLWLWWVTVYEGEEEKGNQMSDIFLNSVEYES